MIFELPYPPSANRYYRVFRGHAVKSAEARAYQAKVAKLARVAGAGQPIAGAVRLCITVYRPQKRGDLDNFLKVLIDAIKGVVFVDDDQVVDLCAHRRDDKSNPRAVVEVDFKGGST